MEWEQWHKQLLKAAQDEAVFFGIPTEMALSLIKRGADLGLQRAKEIVRETEASLMAAKLTEITERQT